MVVHQHTTEVATTRTTTTTITTEVVTTVEEVVDITITAVAVEEDTEVELHEDTHEVVVVNEVDWVIGPVLLLAVQASVVVELAKIKISCTNLSFF